MLIDKKNTLQTTSQYKILWKFIIPNFKKLTNHLENTNIPSTNDKTRTFNKIHAKTKLLEHKKMKKKKITQVFERAIK